MALKLYNSYGRKLESFVPLRQGEVKMYTCGPTVWNYAHIGNFRTFVFEDVLRRYLKFSGYRVTQVMNITDVEDNIIKGIRLFKMSLGDLTAFYEAAFKEDLKALGVEPAEVYPRATEHVPEMVAMIQVLLQKGYAYRAPDGSVYFHVSMFKDYGKLSGIKTAELIPGARVSQDHYEKEEAKDFVLWKAWDEDDGDVFWETSLGKGRPGWSIECSAMSIKYLGETFDIHTGGIDNKFPHHENEIAQSEAATGKKFVDYWLHAAHLTMHGEEMHKSAGNSVYLKDLLKEGWDPITVRMFLIAAKYRDTIDLTERNLAQARAQRDRLQDFVRRLGAVTSKDAPNSGKARQMLAGFSASMDDDLNTAGALAAVFSVVKEANKMLDHASVGREEAAELLAALKRIDTVLGVLRFEESAVPDAVRDMISKREEARRSGDYAMADRLRVALLQEGYAVDDTPSGPVWKKVSEG